MKPKIAFFLDRTFRKYDRARRKALALLKSGFRLGGRPAGRETLHDRRNLR